MNSPPSVSAIVPARNEEATIASCVESLAAQPEIDEILVIDDQSTDHTGVILRDLAERIPKLCVLETAVLPKGWVGKNYALTHGAAQARGEWLLFTDADAIHLPGSTARALADAGSTGAALVSYSPEQQTGSWWERMLIPFIFCRLSQLFPYAAVNEPDSAVAAANGQYLLIRRGAYDAIGGHQCVMGFVLEDVELARRVKKAGYGVHFAPGGGIARVRMYRSFGAMWQGWTKNLYPLLGGSPRGVFWELLSVFPWIPVALFVLGGVGLVFPLLGLILLGGRHAAYAALLRRNLFPISRISYYVPAVTLYCCALLFSTWRYFRGRVVWKDREYLVGTPGR